MKQLMPFRWCKRDLNASWTCTMLQSTSLGLSAQPQLIGSPPPLNMKFAYFQLSLRNIQSVLPKLPIQIVHFPPFLCKLPHKLARQTVFWWISILVQEYVRIVAKQLTIASDCEARAKQFMFSHLTARSDQCSFCVTRSSSSGFSIETQLFWN